MRRNGYTIIEFMLALALGIVIVAVSVALGVQRSKDVQNQAMGQAVLRVKAMANAACAQSISYMDANGNPVTLPFLYSLNDRLPIQIVNTAAAGSTPTASQLKDIWGGSIILGVESTTNSATPACAAGPTGPANDLLTITLNNVPSSACMQVIGIVAPHMYDTYVDGNLIKLDPPPSAGAPGRNAVDPVQAGPFCSSGSTHTLKFRALKPLNFANLRDHPMTTHITASELACVQPQYNRIQAALAARETAQQAL